MSNEFIQVVDDEGEETIELPIEDDNTLLLSTLQAQFPGVCGLKYRNPETKSIRGIRLNEGKFYPPSSENGWGTHIYICVFPKENKRKSDDNLENSTAKTKRIEKGSYCSDLIVLGLPWKTTEQNLREHFEEFGEVVMAQVKKDIRSGQPKGFGFIRFASYDSQRRVLAKRHLIGGRWCEVKIPNSKDGAVQQVPCKVYVGRCTEEITADDLKDYFSKFGEITDVFIPKPFRAFAFVTFLDPEVAQSLCGEDHLVKGVSVHVSSAAPKSDQNRKMQQHQQQHSQQQQQHQHHHHHHQNQQTMDGKPSYHSQSGSSSYMQNVPPSNHNGWNSSNRNSIDMPNLQSLGINSQGPSTPNPTPAPPFSQRNYPPYQNQGPGPSFGPSGGSSGSGSNMRPDNFLQQGFFSAWLNQRNAVGSGNGSGGGGGGGGGGGSGSYDMNKDLQGWSRQRSGANTPQSTH